MKRNFLKFCFVGLGSVALLSACVEADNLDSIEQLQDVTAKAKLEQAKKDEASSRQDLADKIYTLQTNIATLKGDIMTLEASENQIEFLTEKYTIEVETKTLEVAANEQLLTIANAVKTSTDYQKSIDEVAAAYQASSVSYEQYLLDFENANGLADKAWADYDNANAKYNSTKNNMASALGGYNTIEDLTLAVNDATSEVASLTDVAAKFAASERTVLAAKTAASADRDAKEAAYYNAKAIVDNKILIGQTPTTGDNDAVTAANAAWSASKSNYNTEASNYDAAYSALETANTNLANKKTLLGNLQDDVAAYNAAKGSLDALLSARITALSTANALDLKVDESSAKLTAISNIKTAQKDLLDALKSDKKNNIDVVISGLETAVNDGKSAIQTSNDKIAQLAAGYNTTTSKLVAEWIAAATQKIAAYEAIIASYKI